jgi:polyisoprenoid-binding protein YceI
MYPGYGPLLLALLAVGGFSAAGARADTYILDKQRTEVRFTWDHLGLSRQGGRFTDITGRVELDPDNLQASSVEVSIPVASVSTGVAKLDEHLVKSGEFFDSAAHPKISFTSTSVRMNSDRTGDVTGDLSINGISKPVTLDFVWNFVGPHPLASINPVYAGHYSAGFSATTQIRRSDWGITRTIPYISDEIQITIEVEMHREGGAPEPEPASVSDMAGPSAPEDPPDAASPKFSTP